MALDVRDDLLAQNTKRYVLEVSGGRAAVRRSRRGERGGDHPRRARAGGPLQRVPVGARAPSHRSARGRRPRRRARQLALRRARALDAGHVLARNERSEPSPWPALALLATPIVTALAALAATERLRIAPSTGDALAFVGGAIASESCRSPPRHGRGYPAGWRWPCRPRSAPRSRPHRSGRVARPRRWSTRPSSWSRMPSGPPSDATCGTRAISCRRASWRPRPTSRPSSTPPGRLGGSPRATPRYRSSRSGARIPGAPAVAPVLRVGDLLFFALVLGVVTTHGLPLLRAAALGLGGVLVAGALAAWLAAPIPALVPIAGLSVLGLPAARRLRPEDRRVTVMVVVIALGVAGGVVLQRYLSPSG